MNSIASNVRRRRQGKHLSIRQAAELADIPQSEWAAIERGRHAEPETLEAIADILDVAVQGLTADREPTKTRQIQCQSCGKRKTFVKTRHARLSTLPPCRCGAHAWHRPST